MNDNGMEIGAACAWAVFAPLIAFGLLVGLAGGGILLFPFLLVFVFVYGAPIAAAHVFLVWLPAWLLLKRRLEPGAAAAAALGFACGALPITVIAWAWGWMTGVGPFAGLFGGCGVIGGFAFWWRLNRERI
ncbi:MAG: hypothetical protein QOI38_473 [Sphingomonadales bacterium]|jgi:hypothetical protein|nr:hypothetical protein [Sphingomonadales bacterium]